MTDNGGKGMDQGKDTDVELLKSKITDDLVYRMREESLKINFGKIILNISPKDIIMEYTKTEKEKVFR
jgi:hypothetical protein